MKPHENMVKKLKLSETQQLELEICALQAKIVFLKNQRDRYKMLYKHEVEKNTWDANRAKFLREKRQNIVLEIVDQIEADKDKIIVDAYGLRGPSLDSQYLEYAISAGLVAIENGTSEWSESYGDWLPTEDAMGFLNHETEKDEERYNEGLKKLLHYPNPKTDEVQGRI
ncbi:MAG: hypothetical protein CMI29_04835 [Opitutae bacterium]|nr:hypothetical protein [Opitutae bacterium]|tara:strand:- start:5566 stop:6072 length:507 start_codon:yes stop_codon:yes gene_type:complete